MNTYRMLINYILCAFLISTLGGCGGGSSGNADTSSSAASSLLASSVTSAASSSAAADTTPSVFSFSDQLDVSLNSAITSNSIEVSGINTPTTISISGGTYSIDAGAFTAAIGTVSNHQQVRVQLVSATEGKTTTSATLTIGSVSATFSVTTKDVNAGLIEAEDTELFGGGGAIFTDEIASNGKTVGNLLTEGAGIQLTAPSSIGVSLIYKSSGTGSLRLKVNDENAGTLTLEASDTFINTELETPIPGNATISILRSTGDSETYIDSLRFIPSPLQQVSTFGNTGFTEGDGVSVAADGSVYVSGGPRGKIVRFSPEGIRSTLISGYGYLADSDFDSDGNLYVADYGGSAIRRITPEGTVSTFASNLNGPASVYIDTEDNLYIGLYGANYSGTGASVMRITPDGTKSIYATGGGLKDVIGVTGDEHGNIYAGNRSNGKLYRVTDGNVSALATTGITINQIDYSRGYIYLAQNSRILRVSTKGVVEAFAGTATAKTINGKLAEAEFTDPNSLAFSPDGNILYVYDGTTGDVRKIAAE